MKKWLMVAGILLAAGLILGTVCLAIVGFDFMKLGTKNMQTHTYAVEEAFTHIRVEGITADITFQPAEDLQVVCYVDEKTPFSVYVEDDTLVITCKDNRKWYDHIGFNWASAEVTVYLPGGEYGDLQISCTTGDILVPEQFTFQNAKVDLTTGDINWKSAVRQDLTVECTTGDVTLTQVLCNHLFVKLSTGDVTLNGVDATELTIKTTTGDVTLNGVDATELAIKTTTGDVTGTLLTQKVFSVKTSTGRVQVPNGTGGGICQVETTTGDVSLQIQ